MSSVKTISLAEPGHTALTRSAIVHLAEAIDGAREDPACRVALIASTASDFSSGGDISDFLAGPLDEFQASVRRLMVALASFDKPLIAAVEGKALGFGATMLLHCDAVFAAETSVFSAPFLDLGLVPESGSTLLAPKRFGRLRAFEMFCLGRTYSAPEAEGMGLVTQVTPHGRAHEHAMKACARLSRQPSEAVIAIKKMISGDAAELIARIDVELGFFRTQLEMSERVRRFAKISHRRAAA